jgi:hypothetical protein
MALKKLRRICQAEVRRQKQLHPRYSLSGTTMSGSNSLKTPFIVGRRRSLLAERVKAIHNVVEAFEKLPQAITDLYRNHRHGKLQVRFDVA